MKNIHTLSVRDLCSRDYSPSQIDVWTSGTDDGFAEVIKQSPFSLVYEVDGVPVGFATLRPNNSLWHLYVLPSCSRKGIGSALLAGVEDYLLKQSASFLGLESSVTARNFYIKHGYDVLKEKVVQFGGVDIPVIAMMKKLQSSAGQ